MKYIPKIPQPTVTEVENYLNKWNSLENYVLQERSLDKLFFETYPKNNDINDILIKCSSLNDFYSTNIFSIFPVAKHILDLNIDDRLRKGDPTLVNDIARMAISGKDKNFYSFATKYCSHHNPKEFPIYDSFVDKVLWHFKKVDKFARFTRNELKEYEKFKNVLLEFKKVYKIEQYNLKDLDRYLWQLGKDYFPRQYKKKNEA